MHVRWDETAQATPHGQIVYFAEFLATAGIFESWVQSCSLRYSSPNAPGVRDVLGTLMLSILAGSKRYAHIAGIRGDAVAAQALGLNKIVSEDSVRRALKAIEPQAAQSWMHQALQGSVAHALDRAWILDMDTTIKTLYGHQEGAEIGYNPHKPGAGPATPCTPTGWATCAGYWICKCAAANNIARAMPKRVWPSCSMNSVHAGRRWYGGTAATATRTSSKCAKSEIDATCCACAKRPTSSA